MSSSSKTVAELVGEMAKLVDTMAPDNEQKEKFLALQKAVIITHLEFYKQNDANTKAVGILKNIDTAINEKNRMKKELMMSQEYNDKLNAINIKLAMEVENLQKNNTVVAETDNKASIQIEVAPEPIEKRSQYKRTANKLDPEDANSVIRCATEDNLILLRMVEELERKLEAAQPKPPLLQMDNGLSAIKNSMISKELISDVVFDEPPFNIKTYIESYRQFIFSVAPDMPKLYYGTMQEIETGAIFAAETMESHYAMTAKAKVCELIQFYDKAIESRYNEWLSALLELTRQHHESMKKIEMLEDELDKKNGELFCAENKLSWEKEEKAKLGRELEEFKMLGVEELVLKMHATIMEVSEELHKKKMNEVMKEMLEKKKEADVQVENISNEMEPLQFAQKTL